MIKLIPNKKNIGAEIICDLRKLSKEDLKKLKSALYKYGVIFFKKQKLTSSMYLKCPMLVTVMSIPSKFFILMILY